MNLPWTTHCTDISHITHSSSLGVWFHRWKNCVNQMATSFWAKLNIKTREKNCWYRCRKRNNRWKTECRTKNSATGINNANFVPFISEWCVECPCPCMHKLFQWKWCTRNLMKEKSGNWKNIASTTTTTAGNFQMCWLGALTTQCDSYYEHVFSLYDIVGMHHLQQFCCHSQIQSMRFNVINIEKKGACWPSFVNFSHIFQLCTVLNSFE